MQAPVYEIRIEGYLSAGWLYEGEGLEVRCEACGETVIRGPLDQAARYGLLARLGSLNLAIICVRRVRHV